MDLSQPLRAATWNLQSCRRGLPGIVRVLRSLEADVIALQEVDRHTGRSGGIDQAQQLARGAGFAHWRFFRALSWDGGDYGLALLSRHPLVDCRSGLLPNEERLEPRIVASAVVDLPGGQLAVHTTHLTNLDTSSGLRKAQAKRVLDNAERSALPSLVLGDFNALPAGPACRLLRKKLRDVFAEVGQGPGGTYPLPFFLPALRLDHAFASPELGLVAARVVRSDASDHWPLVMDLRVPASRALRLARA